MKATGKINPITGEEIFRAEESDITFLDKEWEELTIEEISMICSLFDVKYYAKSGPHKNDHILEDAFFSLKLKHKLQS